ncbi:VOC family protein [Rummeliibacillus stabekisii]|uniref:VOC family protein n=1 Tax=Rummeliibacillus stabekisii TaxID=241244 RepID=UPI00203C3699|nr:VOC family protein [Rummeliibacillus stabekisii]MCM3316748.1 VOC family protein [Rummeliibacillus stabekisii]
MIKGLYEAHLPVSNLNRSVEFYLKLDLEIAYQSEKVVFFWIDKGKSWLGLWETDKVRTPYHPSLRHVAFRIDRLNMNDIKNWLEERGVAIKSAFGFSDEEQPLVLNNNPQAHAAIYFEDPDGNSLECISPLRLNFEEAFEKMSLKTWEQIKEKGLN